MMGERRPSHFADNQESGTLDFFDAKGTVESLLDSLHVNDVRYEAAQNAAFRPGRTARLLAGDKPLGLVGELHPLAVEAFDIPGDQPVLAAELYLENLLPLIPPRHRVEPLPQYPAVREDLALVVDQSVTAAELTTAIQRIGGYLLKSVELFDLYEGKQLPSGKKSLAYHLTFQSGNKTLTDKEVSKTRQRIVDQLGRQLGAKLR
jgi:phenylalanyl-tRNA synthetase beta chain